MTTSFVFIRRNADRLFAAFGLLGALLLAKAGHYADTNGDADNIYLSSAGIIEMLAQLYQLIRAEKSYAISPPCYILAGLCTVASGLGLFGLSQGSVSEIATGFLWMGGAFFIFYGDKAFPSLKIRGTVIGSWLYQVCLLPLLYAGMQHHNPYEWGTAVSWAISNVVIAMKPRASQQP